MQWSPEAVSPCSLTQLLYPLTGPGPCGNPASVGLPEPGAECQHFLPLHPHSGCAVPGANATPGPSSQAHSLPVLTASPAPSFLGLRSPGPVEGRPAPLPFPLQGPRSPSAHLTSISSLPPPLSTFLNIQTARVPLCLSKPWGSGRQVKGSSGLPAQSKGLLFVLLHGPLLWTASCLHCSLSSADCCPPCPH